MSLGTELINRTDATVFEEARPGLLGLAYRILGSVTDAEDAVQDTFLKWANTDRGAIENPASWLTTACTRRCIDLLRAAHRSRVNYVGAWLPEPIQKTVDGEETSLDLAESLRTAFLLMLERLTPKERAAYLLHDIFDLSYTEIADALEMQESACRKLVSRAKQNIDRSVTRSATPVARQNELLRAFQTAVQAGKITELATLLSEEVRLTADGGGKVPAILKVLSGVDEVGPFIADRLHVYWAEFAWEVIDLNGTRGILLRHRDRIEAAVSFAYNERGSATDIYIVRNPEKLANLGDVQIH
ncbi:MAG: RNA polymerase sigma factor SigJ [Pseudomonadota bacterium]